MEQTFEIAKIVIGALTPISIAGVGWVLNTRLKTIEQRQWGKRKLIEKRLEIFERTSPNLNHLYCFSLWVGNWKELTPNQVLGYKRALDKEFNINRFLIGENVYEKYQTYIHSIFQTFNAVGSDAKLRVPIYGHHGDRRKLDGWEDKFTTLFCSNISPKSEIHNNYNKLMLSFKAAIGILDE